MSVGKRFNKLFFFRTKLNTVNAPLHPSIALTLLDSTPLLAILLYMPSTQSHGHVLVTD